MTVGDVTRNMAIECVRVSKILRGGPRRLSRGSKNNFSFKVFAEWTVLTLDKIFISLSPRVITFQLNNKTKWQMFLLHRGRHISVPFRDANMASPPRVWKRSQTSILGSFFIRQSSFISQILDLIYWMVTIFIFDGMIVKTRCKWCPKYRVSSSYLHTEIYTVRLCRIRQAYDRSTAWIVSCKSNLQLAYDCCLRQKKCRTIWKHVLKRCDNRSQE